MKDKTLLIMAAGLGSRFGGLKQLEPIGPNGEFIIDYSIYDAKEAGFNKVVFIIKEENYEAFKETIGSRVEKSIKTEYVFQDFSNIPEEYKNILGDRTKPLGTAHAIYCAKDVINEPFVVINADDYYGKSSFEKASSILNNLREEEPYEYAMIGYQVINTMTENGSVKRGICKVEDKKLAEITECSIEKVDNKIIATPLEGDTTSFEIAEDTIVSMNLLLFTPSLFKYIEKELTKFLESNKEDLSKCEFFIPDVMFNSIKEGYATVTVEDTDAKWYGMTYKEDEQIVKDAIKEFIDEKIYPEKLWN